MSNAPQYQVFITSNGADDGAICAFNLDTATGALELTQRNEGISNPFYIALSPDRKFLYSVLIKGDFENDSGGIAAFAVGDNGTLEKINERSAQGTTTCYVDIDPTGKAVVFANYSSGSIGSFAVQEDGSLSEMVSFVQNEGASQVNTARQEGPHAHCAVISPSGRHMHACDLGTDQIFGFALDAASATLTPLVQSYVRTIGGGGPRHFTYHPEGGYVYANNELANSVNVYRRSPDTGALSELQVISTLPEDFTDTSYTADIKITPNGQYLYCSNRLHDSIAAYRIGPDGRLEPIEFHPSRGTFAQNLAITPDGGTLLCANMTGDNTNITVFRIDPDSGKLEDLSEPLPLADPSCIQIA
ncbi:MAG: beta-propeller fold lactonase family protein [Candidatus Latescibacteria bacterium]|nr:beta-propeller fold lactonase family protein [Candidatus Latescibacterota bacterium]